MTILGLLWFLFMLYGAPLLAFLGGMSIVIHSVYHVVKLSGVVRARGDRGGAGSSFVLHTFLGVVRAFLSIGAIGCSRILFWH